MFKNSNIKKGQYECFNKNRKGKYYKKQKIISNN